MALNCGIIGLSSVGKTTIFNCISNTKAEIGFASKSNIGMCEVVDERLKLIDNISHSKRIVPATVEIVDLPGLSKGGQGVGNKLLAEVQTMDALIHVLRCFDDPNIPHSEGSIDPLRDMELVDLELQVRDLDLVTRKLERTQKMLKNGEKDFKKAFDVLTVYKETLENFGNARDAKVAEEDKKYVQDIQLLTAKPMIYVCNVDDASATTGNKYSDAVKAALKERYPNTKIKDDRLVVDVFFTDFKFEVQPVFEEQDGDETNYKFPDVKYNSYRITKPKQEQAEMTSFRQEHGDTHRLLCKMIRAWKNNVGLAMCGLLIDTLTHRFLSEHSEYDHAGTSVFDELCRDFFDYLKDEPKKDHYQALGSGQDIKVKKQFQTKAKKAYNKAVEAIDETDEAKRNDLWREIFGRQFPKATCAVTESREFSSSAGYTDPEQFIEDLYPVDIRYNVTLDCEVKRNGFREALLSKLLASGQRVSRVRSLDFFIVTTDVVQPFEVKWKVRNVGDEAKRRNCLRGEIINSNRNGGLARHESSDFCGPHYVECYILKDGIVVARDRISVPIE